MPPHGTWDMEAVEGVLWDVLGEMYSMYSIVMFLHKPQKIIEVTCR